MEKVKYIEYHRNLVDYAKENRKFPTREEWVFWHLLLKHKKFKWYKFRRQKVIWPFILDFYCPKLLLWIEIDGWYHNETQNYDTFRDSIIRKKWIKIIRFTNNDINTNLEWVSLCLKNIIESREKEIRV